jgi:hypothetical protein
VTVAEDLRLTVRFHSERQRTRVLRGLSEHATAALAEDRVKGLVSVHREGPWLRLYASSYDSLARAQEAIVEAVTEMNLNAEERPERFDQDRGEWAPVDLPLLSEIEAQRIQMHRGEGQWGGAVEADRVTIHFEFDRREKAAELANHLTEQGYEAHRHWSYVFVFVDDRDAAETLLAGLDAGVRGDAQVFLMGDGPRTFFI